jgi:hypothetical protein
MPTHFSALRFGRFLPYPELKGIVSLEAEVPPITIHLRGRGSCGIGYLGTVAPWSWPVETIRIDSQDRCPDSFNQSIPQDSAPDNKGSSRGRLASLTMFSWVCERLRASSA